MGSRGPAPKPTAIKKAEGNPGKRSLNKHEPKPRPTMPAMPAWLEGFAVEFWQRNAAILHRLGVLTEGDGEAFAKLCQSYQAWRVAVERYKNNPDDWHLGIAEQTSHKIYAADLQQFGMTPASRTRIQVAGSDEGSEIDDLL